MKKEKERERERKSKNRKIFEIDKKVASFLDEQPDLANTCQTNFKCSLTESFFCNLSVEQGCAILLGVIMRFCKSKHLLQC